MIQGSRNAWTGGYGGNPVKDEAHATPTAQELNDAIEEIIDIRRTLRFIGP